MENVEFNWEPILQGEGWWYPLLVNKQCWSARSGPTTQKPSKVGRQLLPQYSPSPPQNFAQALPFRLAPRSSISEQSSLCRKYSYSLLLVALNHRLYAVSSSFLPMFIPHWVDCDDRAF